MSSAADVGTKVLAGLTITMFIAQVVMLPIIIFKTYTMCGDLSKLRLGERRADEMAVEGEQGAKAKLNNKHSIKLRNKHRRAE